MPPNELSIVDRVAVVIGGTSGIGRALAVGLARHGAHVVATGRREKEVDDAATEIEGLGRQTVRCPADARTRASIDHLRETFKEPTLTVDEDRFSALMDTHLMSVLRACQSFHALLVASGHGRIINIASLGSFLAFHQVAAYCAAKTAILAFVDFIGGALLAGSFPAYQNEGNAGVNAEGALPFAQNRAGRD